MGGEPHLGLGLHMLDEFLQDDDARAMAHDVWSHGQDEQGAFLVGDIELLLPNVQNILQADMRSNGVEAAHAKVSGGTQNPFHR